MAFIRTRALALAVLALAAMFSSGCFSFNWAHNRRHIKVVFDDIAELHRDLDKTIFGLDRYPAEK